VSTPRSMAAPLSSSPRSPTSWAPSPIRLPRDARGLRERGGEVGAEDLFGGMSAALGSDWGFWWLLAECRLEAQFSLTVAAGLNNQQVGKSYCSEVQESLPKFRKCSEVEGSFGGLFGLNF
jgi:hypothetical protein